MFAISSIRKYITNIVGKYKKSANGYLKSHNGYHKDEKRVQSPGIIKYKPKSQILLDSSRNAYLDAVNLIHSQTYGAGTTGLFGAGLTGYTSYTGLRGCTGLQGSTGLQGVTGTRIAGLRGSTGITGFSGYAGSTGIMGVSGYSRSTASSGYEPVSLDPPSRI
jgi:hypothetical protein